VAEPPGMHSQAEPGNEIVSIISTPYRDVYNDKPQGGNSISIFVKVKHAYRRGSVFLIPKPELTTESQ